MGNTTPYLSLHNNGPQPKEGPANSGILDSSNSPTEDAIDTGNDNGEGPANSGILDSSISPTEDASLLQTGQTKEDAIDVGKERVTKQKVDNYWKKELELRESDKKQILEGKWLNDKHINAVNNLFQKRITDYKTPSYFMRGSNGDPAVTILCRSSVSPDNTFHLCIEYQLPTRSS